MEKAIDRQRVLLRHLNPAAAAASAAPPAISVRIPSLTRAKSLVRPLRRRYIRPPDLLLTDEGAVCGWVRGRRARARRGTARRTTGRRPSLTTSSSSRK